MKKIFKAANEFIKRMFTASIDFLSRISSIDFLLIGWGKKHFEIDIFAIWFHPFYIGLSGTIYSCRSIFALEVSSKKIVSLMILFIKVIGR